MTLFVTDLPISAYIMLSTIRFLKWVTRNTLYCQFKILFVCRITILMTFQQGKACYKQILKGLFQLTLCQIEFFLNKFLTKWRAFTVRIFCCFVFSSPGQIPASVGSDDYFSLPTPDELFNIYKTWYRSFLDREYLSWFFFNETQR